MAFLDKMFRGSFRNVQFLVPRESEDGGNKIVKHEYPGSGIRYAENLGQIPSDFSLDVIIHGDDVDEQRRLLRAAMLQEGIGTLVHPIYGSIEVQPVSFTISSSETEVGIVNFTLNFTTTNFEAVSLTAEGAGRSEVSAAAQEARVATDDALGEEYSEPTLVDNIRAAGDKVTEITEAVFRSVSSVVNPVQDGVSELTRTVNEISRSVFSIVRKADSLKSSLRALYDSALMVAGIPADLYDAWLELTDFGFIDQPKKTNTVKRAQEESNRLTLNDHTRVNALINAYESAAYIDFETDDEINTVREQLEREYVALSEVGGGIIYDTTVRASVNNLRNLVRDSLNSAENNVWSVTTVVPARTSASILTYQYYGNLDNLDVIRNLNPAENHAHINDGQIKVVS